jgi:serine/threonine protein kinase
VHIHDFQLLQIIGTGSCGRVWKAIYKKNNQTYAVKEISKFLIDQYNNRTNIETERKTLEEILTCK